MEANLGTARPRPCFTPLLRWPDNIVLLRFYSSCLGNKFPVDRLPGGMWGQQQGLANEGGKADYREWSYKTHQECRQRWAESSETWGGGAARLVISELMVLTYPVEVR